MVYHLSMPEIGVLPVQSPVGMQLGKAIGYAKGFQAKGIQDAVTIGIVGDGTTAEGDMHDAMNAASVWRLPTIIMVTDNAIAISTDPGSGRGIKDFQAYAAGFNIRHFSCDGGDFWDVYQTTFEAATYAREALSAAVARLGRRVVLDVGSKGGDHIRGRAVRAGLQRDGQAVARKSLVIHQVGVRAQ